MNESYLHKQHFWQLKVKNNHKFLLHHHHLQCSGTGRLLSRVGKKCSHCSRPGYHHYLHCKHFITQWTTEKQRCLRTLYTNILAGFKLTVKCQYKCLRSWVYRINVAAHKQRASSYQGRWKAEDGQEGTGRSEGCVFADSGLFPHLNISCGDVIGQWFWDHRLLLFTQGNVAPAGKADLILDWRQQKVSATVLRHITSSISYQWAWSVWGADGNAGERKWCAGPGAGHCQHLACLESARAGQNGTAEQLEAECSARCSSGDCSGHTQD